MTLSNKSMKNITNTFLSVGDKFTPQMHLILFRMGFGTAHGWGVEGQENPSSPESVTRILQW